MRRILTTLATALLSLLCASAAPIIPKPQSIWDAIYRDPPPFPSTRMAHYAANGTDVFSLCAAMDKFSPFVAFECQQRFSNPVVIISHGDSMLGVWTFDADTDRGGRMLISWFAMEMTQRYPGRDIVLWSCNPGDETLNIPRVWYFRTKVWCVPDGFVDARLAVSPSWWSLINSRETMRYYGTAGSIWEAVTEGRRFAPTTFPWSTGRLPTTRPSYSR